MKPRRESGGQQGPVTPCTRTELMDLWQPPWRSQSCAAMNLAPTLGVAASRTSLNDGATVRNVYSGHSGRAGYEALSLRDAGFTGEANALASIMGNIYGSEFDAGMATAELGQTWWIRRNYFKRFAAGR